MSCSSSTSAVDTTATTAARPATHPHNNNSSNNNGDDTSSTTDTIATTAPLRRAIRTCNVDSRWLFNNFYVGELIVDTRSRAAFERATILGAISIPPVVNCASFADVVAQCGAESGAASLSPRKRTLRDIVLFADRTQLSSAASWVFTLQQLLEAEGLVASVKVLSDSFSAFRRRYPFYTTDAAAASPSDGVIQCGAHRVTYPNEIVECFLYLGNMWQAESHQVVRDLGITHIVNATLDLGNVFERHGVQYHEVKIKDEAAADIAAFFDATFAFIDSAKQTDQSSSSPRTGRVLVHCTQGISRSATLVIMYLMRAHRWSLVQAFNYTRAGRGVIIPNDGFVRALLAEERRLHARNSVDEHELDLLLQGRLEDRSLAGASEWSAGASWRRASGNCRVM